MDISAISAAASVNNSSINSDQIAQDILAQEIELETDDQVADSMQIDASTASGNGNTADTSSSPATLLTPDQKV